MSVKVVGVIPVFRAPEELPETVAALRTQLDAIVLVDDGSHTISEGMFTGDGIVTAALPENSGIAHALNVAIAEARALGATHVLTLDQDSRIAEGHVSRLLSVLDASARDGLRVAAAVPGVVGGAPILLSDEGEAFDPIQSGQLIPVPVLDAVGPFNEELFIDAVDSEFTARAKGAGYRFVPDVELSMEHALGELVPLSFLGRPLRIGGRQRHVLYHSPARTYYMVRNSAWLDARYRRLLPAWCRLRARKMAEMVWGCVLLAPDRRQQFRAVRWGKRDGRRGVLGKIDAAVVRGLTDTR